MKHKIFISYKYGDTSVYPLDRVPWDERTKVRHYVDELQEKFDEEDQINKGELDGEDLSKFKDPTIESKLRDKIYDSSVTIVLISPNMKELNTPEDDQWIPWEIAYSLRESTRNGRTSRTNGVLAVVLPDTQGKYEYILKNMTCCLKGCTIYSTNGLFKILKLNMFNKKDTNPYYCENGYKMYKNPHSYICMISWKTFISNINYWIEVAEDIRADKDSYNIFVNVK